MTWKPVFLRALRTIPGLALAFVGLSSMPDDLSKWKEWVTDLFRQMSELDQDTLRWIFVIAGVALVVALNLPWGRILLVIKSIGAPKGIGEIKEQVHRFLRFLKHFTIPPKYDRMAKRRGYDEAERELRKYLHKQAIVVHVSSAIENDLHMLKQSMARLLVAAVRKITKCSGLRPAHTSHG